MPPAPDHADHVSRSRADPAGDHLPARLEGERPTPAGYVRQPASTALDGTLMLRSETLQYLDSLGRLS